MNLHKKSRFSRIAIGLVVLWVVVSVAVPREAHAAGALHWLWDALVGDSSALTDISLSVVGWVAYGINYVVSIIVGLFISVVVYGIGIILQLNGNVMNTLAVQTGFQVTLAVANLGFVLGIIIIAIATILRRQTYGVKSLLWKLVFAAVLVNFSLIIGGVIINAANSLTTFFLKPFPGGGNGAAGFNGFADALSGAFSPQRPWLTGIVTSAENASKNTDISTLAGSEVASQILPIFSVVFTVVMLITIFITLCVFFFMLIIRYLYLTFLLILMPLAWLLWIFPLSSGYLKKWWNEFLRWTFFAPIVMFFLYLSIATAGQMSANNKNVSGVAANLAGLGYQSTGNGTIINGLSSAFGTMANVLMGTFLQMIVIVGLAIGGLYTANKFSIMGAQAGMNAMTGVKNAALGYAGRRGAQAGGAVLNSARMRERARNMQQPDRGLISRYTGRLLQGTQQALGPKLVEQKAQAYSGLSPERLRDRISTAEGEYGRQAVLGELLKKDPSKLRDYSREEQEKYFGKGKEEEFARNGNEKLFKEVRRRSGKELEDLDQEIAGLGKEGFEAAKSHNLIAADRAAKQIEKKKGERVALVTKMVDEDPAVVAENFDDDEAIAGKRAKSKEKTGRVSANLDGESIKRMRDAIVTSMAEGFSSENAGSLIKAIAKKNNLPEFERYIKGFRDSKDPGELKKFNDLREAFKKNISLLRWFEKNAGKSLINHRDLFKLTDADIPAEAKPSRKGARRAGPTP